MSENALITIWENADQETVDQDQEIDWAEVWQSRINEAWAENNYEAARYAHTAWQRAAAA